MSSGPGPPTSLQRRRVAGGDLPVRDGLAVAKSSIIGHLFAGEKGVRSSVRRDNSLRGTGGCGKRVFVLSQRLRQEVSVAGHEIRPAHQDVAPE